MLSRLFLVFCVTIAVSASSSTVKIHQPWKSAVPLLRRVVTGTEVRPGKLVNETDDLLKAIQRSYDGIAIYYKDNEDEDKYIQSVIDYFILSFTREYSITKDDYAIVYDNVLKDMKQYSEYTAIELASPVRRHLDIMMSIISTPITLVQTHCQRNETTECDQKYFAAAFLESTKCRHIFHHHAVFSRMRDFNEKYEHDHLKVLKQVMVEVKTLCAENSVFDAILMALEMVKMELKDQLIFMSEIHSMVVKYQSDDKLRCFAVYRDPE